MCFVSSSFSGMIKTLIPDAIWCRPLLKRESEQIENPKEFVYQNFFWSIFTRICLPFFWPTSNVSHFYRTQVNLGSDLWVRMSITMPPCWDLTDVTLDDEDANSILTDNAKRAIQGNVGNTSYATWWPTLQTMQVPPPDDQMLNQSKLCHLVAKYATYAGGAIWWPNLQLIHVVPSGGQIFN